MKHVLCSIAAMAALSLAGFAHGQTTPQEPAAQPYPSEQPLPAAPAQTMPSERQMPAPMTPATPAQSQAGSSTPPPADQGPVPAATAEASRSSGNTRLAAIVPPGMTPREACTGFNNISMCVMSLHVARNLGLAFADLKARITGGQKLDAAVHEMKPEVDAQAEVLKAQEQTRADLRPAQG